MKEFDYPKLWLFILVTLVFAGSCTEKEKKVAVDLHESPYLKCTTPEECGGRVNCINGSCAQAYWQDDLDAGDDIWAPGCHWQFSDNKCSEGKTFYKGDYCSDVTHLEEYTETKCHTDKDRKSYDCDQECKRIGKFSGSCATVTDACGKGNNSAQCKCEEADVAPPIILPPSTF